MRLMDTGDDSFVSRSQAKRALARLPRFKEVLLDFDGVQSITTATTAAARYPTRS